jgi:hypothetical protein
MKKVLITLLALLAVGCSEKTEYEKAVLEQMAKDKDIVDYHIAPEDMVECVVVTSSKEMPGLLPIDPDRRQAYINYTKMLQLSESTDPQKTLEELRKDFGDPKALADAHANYAESVVNCMSGLVTGTEEGLKGGENK